MKAFPILFSVRVIIIAPAMLLIGLYLPTAAFADDCCDEDTRTSSHFSYGQYIECNDNPLCSVYCVREWTIYSYEVAWEDCDPNYVLARTDWYSCYSGTETPPGCQCDQYWVWSWGPYDSYMWCYPMKPQ